MNFFRNPEIKHDIIIYTVLTLLALTTGFFISIPCGILLTFICIMFITLHFVSNFKRYQTIAALSQTIDRILHGEEGVSFDEYNEGELAILNNEIRKMTLSLREKSDDLLKDKIHLTDSIADISHQLKTPLTSINLLLSILRNPDTTNERRYQLTKEIERLTDRIDWLITSLLKLSKIDAGTAYFKKNNIMLQTLMDKVLSPIAIPIELKCQQINVKIEENASYIGDLSWSVEAVGNIIKNSMEHTPIGGSIDVVASENAIYTEIIIQDNGKGIDPSDLPHIFERFYKGKHSDEHSVGIGLALARRIITEQNGTVKVENNAGPGARFTIRFYKGRTS